MTSMCAIIPAYNVQDTVGQVVSGVSQFIPKNDIVVIDDGSSDSTSTVAQKAGALILRNRKNQGKGAALKLGFRYALEQNYQAVICLDGDMQHHPDDLVKFLDCYKNSNADIILGNRISDLSTMPRDRQLSNQLTSLIISVLTGQRIRDSQSGYRLIKTDVIKRINLTTNKYQTESELLVKALKDHFKITHVPIRTIYNDQPSHIHRLIDTWRFVKIVVLSLMNLR